MCYDYYIVILLELYNCIFVCVYFFPRTLSLSDTAGKCVYVFISFIYIYIYLYTYTHITQIFQFPHETIGNKKDPSSQFPKNQVAEHLLRNMN